MDSSVMTGPFDGVAQTIGSFPAWLRGRLIRTAPALFEQNGWTARHWFDGLGMLYSFEIEGPERVSWMQRLLECDVSRSAAKSGRVPYGTFGSGNGRTLWRRIFEPVAVPTDNANVNVVPMGPEWVAMTESNRQIAVDPASLATRGHVAYDDDLPRRMIMTAHPHHDVARDLVVNVGSVLGARPECIVYSHAPASRRRTVVGRWPAPRIPYVHSFGLTAEKAVLIAHPMDLDPKRLLWSNDFVEHFRWRPERATRLVVIDRSSGSVETFETDPLFVFHTVNTFQDGGDLVLDVLAYPDATIMTEAFRIEPVHSTLPDLTPTLTRIRMTLGTGRAKREPLCDVGFEFPSISYRRVSGRRQRFVWGASIGSSTPGQPASQIVRVDLERSTVDRFVCDGFVLGEPVFVAAPSRAAEDDGVILTVGSDPAAPRAMLVALDARDLRLIASAAIDVPLPLGFHGSFQRDSGGDKSRE